MISKKELLTIKVNGKKHIDNYLKELNSICNHEVTRDDLLSIEETYEIIDKIKIRNIHTLTKRKILFEDKASLKDLIDSVRMSYVNGIYLFTEFSKLCGALYLNSIQLFNLNFEFNAEHSGLISIINKEVTHKILLDFYDEENNHYLDVEIN